MPSKYHNKPTHGFHSGDEYKRYLVLQDKERKGEIQNLRKQVPFELLPAQYEGKRCIYRSVKYIADFTYYENGKFIVEDYKGVLTPEYIIKKKMMYYFHRIKIRET